ncbi:hypothetical protein HKD37_18G050749 [Glycine soja]
MLQGGHIFWKIHLRNSNRKGALALGVLSLFKQGVNIKSSTFPTLVLLINHGYASYSSRMPSWLLESLGSIETLQPNTLSTLENCILHIYLGVYNPMDDSISLKPPNRILRKLNKLQYNTRSALRGGKGVQSFRAHGRRGIQKITDVATKEGALVFSLGNCSLFHMELYVFSTRAFARELMKHWA